MDATNSVGDSVHQMATEEKQHLLANDDSTNSDFSHIYFVSSTVLDGALADHATMYNLIRSLHIDPEHSKIIIMSSRGIDNSLQSPSWQSIISGGNTRPKAFYAASKLPWGGASAMNDAPGLLLPGCVEGLVDAAEDIFGLVVATCGLELV